MAVIDISKISTAEELKTIELKTINEVQNVTGFHQITIDEYLMAKQEIEIRLRRVADDFIAIGFRLRQIRDSESYRQEGYTSMKDFAKKEYDMEESTVSRLISVNTHFSVGGYSDRIQPEYKNYSVSTLYEMIKLTVEDRKLIVAGSTTAVVRELRKFNRESQEYSANSATETEAAEDDNTAETVKAQVLCESSVAYNDFEKVIIEFFRNERELLNEIYQMSDYESIVDRINPSGSRTFRKKIYMLFMYGYGEGLILKKMGEENTSYTWQQFIETTVNVYKATYTDHDTVWENFYKPEPEVSGEKEPEEKEPEVKAAETKISEEAVKADEKQNNGGKQEKDKGNKSIAERAEERKEKHIPVHPVDVQNSSESENKGENAENTKEDITDSSKIENNKTEKPEPAESGNMSEKNGSKAYDSSETLATSQESRILSLRRWYIENKHMSLDMGVKQEIADRLYIRTTPEELEQITEFIEALAVEYTAYVYKSLGDEE